MSERFSIIGDKNKRIRIGITCNPKSASLLCGYLKSLKFRIEEDKYYQYFIEPIEIRKIYKVVTENNSFPIDSLPFLSSLVAAFDWSRVTPLTDEEESVLARSLS